MNEPFGYRVRVPWVGPDTNVAVNERDSASLSLDSTLPARVLSSLTV